MLEEQRADTVSVPASGDTELAQNAAYAGRPATLDATAYPQGLTVLDASPALQSGENGGAEPMIGTLLSDQALTEVQGGISGAGIGGIAGGALGVVGVGVLAAGSGVVAVASAPVLIAAGVVGGVVAGVGAGVGALVDLVKGA